ncbi:SMI1/KNR4 family protein [Thalassotalea atypica]|uniref:SMI1/KNR4 family protein n=1 Tax=Thalassotalea atypica TaxID=2054316 RepID=UPI0025731A18|nr:SMI1/KNR4 family protein [Thalassotalea atypica]
MNHEELLALLNQTGQKNIFFGPQGFELLINEDEVARGQIGYGLDAQGQSLSGESEGDWQYSWLVIAKDTELGDVYFIDLNDDDCPVFTAFKGEDTWEIEQVATSLAEFIACLQVLFDHGQQRSAMFVVESSTIVDPILIKKLQASLIEASQCPAFWTQFINGYTAWLSDE